MKMIFVKKLVSMVVNSSNLWFFDAGRVCNSYSKLGLSWTSLR